MMTVCRIGRLLLIRLPHAPEQEHPHGWQPFGFGVDARPFPALPLQNRLQNRHLTDSTWRQEDMAATFLTSWRAFLMVFSPTMRPVMAFIRLPEGGP